MLKKMQYKPQIMGIVNCTRDSYFEESRKWDTSSCIQHALNLFDEGADCVDIGGESTRPGSTVVTEEEEIQRVLPVIIGLRKLTDKPLSIDTYKPKVAEEALAAGATFLNDITGFSDPHMRTLARTSGVKICVMHALSAPHTHPTPFYPRGVVQEIYDFFERRVTLLLQEGILPSQIILDPGIGGGSFGKTPEDCLSILKHISVFQTLGFPLLLGISRKSFLQKILQKPASELLSTTLALNTMNLLEGASYIRVHDVAPHREIITLLTRLEAIE